MKRRGGLAELNVGYFLYWYPLMSLTLHVICHLCPVLFNLRILPTSPLQLGLTRHSLLSPFSSSQPPKGQLNQTWILFVLACSWWRPWTSPTSTCWRWGRVSTTVQTPTWCASRTMTGTIRRRPSASITSHAKVLTQRKTHLSVFPSLCLCLPFKVQLVF